MYREGHIGLNALLYSPVAVGLLVTGHVELAALGAVVAIGTSTLPDLDLVIPWIRHRGITHTVWFAVTVGLATGYLATFVPLSYEPTVLFAFGALVGAGGILGHLLGDAFTPLGVEPFRPLSNSHYTLGLFTAENWVANNVFLLVGAVALALSFNLWFGVV
ncbi:metal-dependent hydrolase [Halobacteria archaeon AArc-dxtr1]|nr:metal-dependent hydrolase [Halobacteria archaeon AArc-dxtr1]